MTSLSLATTAEDIAGADPVGRLLIKTRMHPAAAVGGAFLGLMVLLGILPHALHLSLATNAAFGLSYRTVVCWLVFLPVVWGFFAWQPYGIASLLTRLADRRQDRAASHTERLAATYKNPAWPLLGGALAAWELYWFSFGKGEFLTVGPWWKAAPGLGYPAGLHVAVILATAATYYAVLLIVIRQCITVAALNSFFRAHWVQVLALHPDRCGGFRFIGDYALAVAPLVAATGLNFSIVLIRVANHEPLGSATAPVTLPLVALAYLSVSVLSFVSPFWTAHRAMRAAKDEQLMPLAEGYQRAQERVDRETREGALDPKSVEQLETIRKACTLAEGVPTWPVHISSVRNFSVALLSPVLPVAVDLLRRAMGLT